MKTCWLGIAAFGWAWIFCGSYAMAAERTVIAHETEESIVLDGALDEVAWSLAEPATDFIQSEPVQGDLATEPTEVRILFDADNLYVGVICFDSHPERIVAKSLRVDFTPSEEDTFEILLDPFASSRDAFLFIITPGGAKRDEQVSNGGRESNVSWDGVWDVKTRRAPHGWTAEIRIPFRTLRYDPKSTEPWNVNFGRRVRRDNEVTNWSEIPRQFNIRQVSLAGRLAGLNGDLIHPGRNLLLTPYFVLNRVDREAGKSLDQEFGADLKYGVTSGLTLDLTYNTDFSHVEVDQQQVNLDRFRLSFPEKRDFFLENAGVFEMGSVGRIFSRPLPESPIVFYSRNIGLSLERRPRPVPIEGGGRLTGRLGSYSLGLMSLQTGEAEAQGPENATVMRVRKDLLTRSYFGGFFLSRSGPERDSNRVFGIDGLYRPRNDLTFNSYFAQSQTPGVDGDDWLLRIAGSYNSRNMILNITHSNIQENYRNDLGFQLRTGVSANRFEWRPRVRPWEGSVLREIRGIVNIRYITDPTGRLVTRGQGTGVDFTFRNGTFLRFRRRNFFERVDDSFDLQGVPIAAGDYNFHEQGIEFNTDRSRTLSGSSKWYVGDFWDGRKTSWEFTGQFRPSSHFSAEISFSQDRARLPEGPFNATLSGLRLQYSPSTVAFVDLFLQYNSEEKRVTSNARFNWIHRPLSDLFVVYTEDRPTIDAGQVERVISLKYTHLIDF